MILLMTGLTYIFCRRVCLFARLWGVSSTSLFLSTLSMCTNTYI